MRHGRICVLQSFVWTSWSCLEFSKNDRLQFYGVVGVATHLDSNQELEVHFTPFTMNMCPFLIYSIKPGQLITRGTIIVVVFSHLVRFPRLLRLPSDFFAYRPPPFATDTTLFYSLSRWRRWWSWRRNVVASACWRLCLRADDGLCVEHL